MNRQWTRTLAASLGLMSWLFAATSAGAQAQGGVIAFLDRCDNRAYVMRGDASGRVRLADLSSGPMDITRGGWPMTVGMYGLYAVEVNDIAGRLEVGPLVSLGTEGDSACDGPAISLVVDRIAYSTNGPGDYDYPKTFWVADLVRDGAGRITGATNHRVLARSDQIGSPSDVVEGTPTYDGLGGIAFSPDGSSLLVGVYGDLWRLHLTASGSLLAKERVTQTRQRIEWGPAFSPDGRKLAFAAIDLKYNTKGLLKGTYSATPDRIYTLTLGSTTAAVALLNKNNMGEAQDSIAGFRHPSWSPDGAYIAFWARGGKRRQATPCGSGNTDIFIIRADGSGQATALTDTPTTSMELMPRWGWQ